MIRSGALPRHCYRDHRPDDHHVKKPSASATAAGKVVKGHRTIALFAELRRIAHNCETIHELDFRASGFNEAMLDPPLTEAKVNRQVRGVWKLKVEGRCIPPGSTVAAIGPEAERLYRDPLALAVWVHIRRHHGPTHEFAVSTTGLAKVFGCHRTSIAKARDFLEQSGFIVQTHTGRGPKDPHRFRLSP